ncbi:MAG: archaeosortase/exosortase family protein, partial [Thermoplasmata archaeon]
MPELEDAMDYLKKYRGYFLLLESIILLTGVNLVILPQKVVWLEYVGVVLFLSGIVLLVLTFMPDETTRKTREKSLAKTIVDFFSVRLKLRPIFPVVGITLIAIDLAYNLLLFESLSLGIHDTMLLLFAVALTVFNYIPEEYEREKNFFLLFSGTLVLILVVPLLLIRLFQGDFEGGVNAYSAVFLVPETSAILNVVGVPNHIGVTPEGIPSLIFPPELGLDNLAVTTSCSGIYSFSIFASAFTAFVLTEFNKVNRRVGALLFLGVLTSYVANLLRIVIVVLVGVWAPGDDPMQSLLQAHSNAGWMIFVLWITVFWLIMYKVLMKKKPGEVEKTRKRGTLCGLCGDGLSPSIPGVRCSCERFYHAQCLEEAGNC